MARLNIAATPGGSTNPSPGIYTLDAGSTVTVTAIPNSGYVFDRWVYNSKTAGQWFSDNPLTIRVSEEADLVAYFKPVTPPSPGKVTLEIKVDPSEAGTTTPSPGVYSYDRYSFVEVVASPYSWENRAFTYWSLNGSQLLVNPAYVYMNRDYTLTAHFEANGVLEVHAYVDNTEVNYNVTVYDSNGVIRGEYCGVTPYSVSIAPGSYRLLCAGEYKDVTIEPGKTVRVDFKFTAPTPPTKAEIDIDAYVDSTSVAATYEVRNLYTDELVSTGVTPAVVSVDPGAYRVICTYAGQTQTKETGRLGAGMSITIVFYFGITPYGHIEVHIYDEKGEVIYPARDSSIYCEVYTKEGVLLVKLFGGMSADVVPGSYTVRAYYPDRPSKSKDISVRPGETVKVEFDFRPTTLFWPLAIIASSLAAVGGIILTRKKR
jgi:hypothetical protein